MRATLRAATALLALAGLTTGGVHASAAPSAPVRLSEYTIDAASMDALRDSWLDGLERRHGTGTWAPMRMELSDADLALMGLPGRDVLRSRSYPTPTMVSRDGTAQQVDLPTLTTFAGAGYFGVRPGAWLLLLTEGVGWCSMAHVFGSPGSYKVSTAGHCGRPGDRATVIAALGNGMAPVLLDIGVFKSSHDGGIGNDWALIDIPSQHQHLVTPTMAFWGGPKGSFTKTGAVVGYSLPKSGLVPTVQTDPDPLLAQQVVHYGHGTGVGAGGTPRSGTAIAWGTDHFSFFGAISPGDSGSGSNTLGGDTLGAVQEAAGINTHIYLDASGRTGVGYLAGTRVTKVRGALADGQHVGYPVPVPFLP